VHNEVTQKTDLEFSGFKMNYENPISLKPKMGSLEKVKADWI